MTDETGCELRETINAFWNLGLGIRCFFCEAKGMEGFLNPEKIINQLELRSDMSAADFGCGSGGWVIPLAKRLKQGKIYAIDILEEPISALKGKAQLEGLSNIETIQADVEKDAKIISESVDLVLATNLFFETEDDAGVMREIKRVLKNKGQLLVVDWKKDAPFGPKGKRISAEEIKKLASEAGFQLKKELDAGSYHYGLVFEK